MPSLTQLFCDVDDFCKTFLPPLGENPNRKRRKEKAEKALH